MTPSLSDYDPECCCPRCDAYSPPPDPHRVARWLMGQSDRLCYIVVGLAVEYLACHLYVAWLADCWR